MKKYFVCIAVISAIMVLSAISAFSQDPQVPAKDGMDAAQEAKPVPVQAPAASPAESDVNADELSIYGEVQAVNTEASSMTVQYYDYDNDEEKTMEVSLDKESKLENVKTIEEVKKGDWVDATYIVAGGRNIAKMISVEVEEPIAEDNAPLDATE